MRDRKETATEERDSGKKKAEKKGRGKKIRKGGQVGMKCYSKN